MDGIDSMTPSYTLASDQFDRFGGLDQAEQDCQGQQDGGSEGPGKGFTIEMNVEPRGPLSSEELHERGRALFLHNPAYTRVFLDTVAACDGEVHTLSELEERIAALPGYEKLKNPPYFPVAWLRDAGALEELYLDADGKLYEAKDVEALDEDAFDDLITQYAFRTSDLGRTLAEELSPAQRFADLLESEPARKETYLELLHFMGVRRSFSEIERLLRGRDVLTLTAEDGTPIQPSLFVDKLNAVGVVAFDGGWKTTMEGKEILDAIGRE